MREPYPPGPIEPETRKLQIKKLPVKERLNGWPRGRCWRQRARNGHEGGFAEIYRMLKSPALGNGSAGGGRGLRQYYCRCARSGNERNSMSNTLIRRGWVSDRPVCRNDHDESIC